MSGKTLSDLRRDLQNSIDEFDQEKGKLFGPDRERMWHSTCGAFVTKRHWWQKPDDPDIPICAGCGERVTEADLLTYDEWKDIVF